MSKPTQRQRDLDNQNNPQFNFWTGEPYTPSERARVRRDILKRVEIERVMGKAWYL